MRKHCKIFWYKLPMVLMLRAPVILILWSVITIGEYTEKAYDWCDEHLMALDN